MGPDYRLFMTQKKNRRRNVFHKAGFTYRNLVGRWLAAAENKRYMQRKRREINPPPYNKRSTDNFVRTPFHTPCSARYRVLHIIVLLSGGNEPPLCKGRWLAQARRRDCRRNNFIVKYSLSRLRRQLPLHKRAFGLCKPFICK